MDNFQYCNYTNMVFGKDTENRVGELTRGMGRRALLHYGGGSIKASGLYDRVVASLRAAGVEIVELGGVQPNPRLALVHEGVALCRERGVDCVLAVGGGSVIDSAKAIAAGVGYDGDVWDFFAGKPIETPILPVGALLTIPAAGSETSFNMVITREEGLIKKGAANNNLRPRFAILNPELTYTLPFYQTACGVSDMLAHIMERYFSNSTQVDFSDRLCEAAMRSILNTAPILKDKPEDYGARANIMWAGTIAHNALLGMGREEDWASHGLGHQLSAIYDLAHGASLSILFPAWIRHVCRDNPARFVQWAVRVLDVDLAFYDQDAVVEEGVRRLEQFYLRMELPIRMSQANIPADRIDEMAEKAAPLGHLRVLTAEDARAIYRLAL